MLRELETVFPDVDLSKIIVIISMQHANIDLVNFGEDVESEKDSLCEQVNYLVSRSLFLLSLLVF
jgi:hypothetical protein